MFAKRQFRKTGLTVNKSTQGETIEMKMDRIINNKEPLKDGAPIIYTERKEGVKPSYNIRTDRFEIAVEATDKIAKSYAARRDEKGKVVQMNNEKGGEPAPTEGTGGE